MLSIVKTIRGVPLISFDILRAALPNIFVLIIKGHSCYISTTRFNMRMFLELILTKTVICIITKNILYIWQTWAHNKMFFQTNCMFY